MGLKQSRLWPAGTLCITIAANIANTGILGFDACFPDSIVGFTPGPLVSNEYVKATLDFLRGGIERLAPQLAQKNINLEILDVLPIPVPPLDLQANFAKFTEAILTVERRHIEASEYVEAMSTSLTARLLG